LKININSPKSSLILLFSLLAYLSFPVLAKATLIGISHDGSVAKINAKTGAGIKFGDSGVGGTNALASNSNGSLFSTYGIAGGSTGFITLDPFSGKGETFKIIPAFYHNIRGLAFSEENLLYMIRDGGVSFGSFLFDELWTIDLANGNYSKIGQLNFSGIQGLDFDPKGALYAWDVRYGLISIDTNTANAEDVNAFMDGSTQIQTILFNSDGILYGARDALFKIDSVTGTSTYIGSGGYSDLRGLEFSVPEPTTMLLLAIGWIGILGLRKRPNKL